VKRRAVIEGLAALLALGACGASHAADDFSGQTRPSWADQGSNPSSPLAEAAALDTAIVALPRSGATLETELRASGHGLSGTVTLQQQRLEGTPARSKAWVNELYAATDIGGWQFSAGKRIVAWDVGYGFRPNDVVQQETRRPLLTNTAKGRPLLMAEYFDASTAWSFVAVNPTKPRAQRGAEEPAFAARVYQRDGSVDWHGFARYGAHTRGSIGAAAAWVASDALELHASLRYLNAADSTAVDPAASGLARSNPWSDATVRRATQLLVGGTWTNAEQVSILAEAWWDGTALSGAQWNGWSQRNRQLAALVGSPAPASAVAGNLAWQANAFGASSNLRRTNLFMRVSWTLEKWQPAFDLLYTPADAGRTVTASLGWQGDRVRVDAGLRLYGGPSDSVFAQLPTRRIAYIAGTWSF